jgi:hypothetical protein
MAEVIDKLKPYLLGWKAYFGLAQTPKVWRTLDEWWRHRLRVIQLKHWRRGSTIYRELINLGAAEQVGLSDFLCVRREETFPRCRRRPL